jgi:acetyl esterase/lipase
MASSNRFVSLVKKLTLLVLVIAVAVPLRYGSTNPKYLRLRVLHSLLSIKQSFTTDENRPTLSTDYRAFENLLRLRPLAAVNSTADPLELTKKVRASMTLGSIVPQPSQCHVNKQVYEYEGHSVDAYWINHAGKEQPNTDRIVLYFHGGGYIMGDVQGKLFDILSCIITFLSSDRRIDALIMQR